jgi:hypothetical protein
MIQKIVLSALIVLATGPLVCAKAFKNLDFELGSVVPSARGIPFDDNDPISAAAALPGWTVKEDTTTCNVVWSYPGLDETSVSLVTPSLNTVPITGNYSVALTSYLATIGGRYYRTSSISQVGDIPFDAQFIQFSLRPLDSTSSAIPYVTVGGLTVPVSMISATGGVQTWSGDISAFAGFSWQVVFSAIPDATKNYGDPSSEDNYVLDSISFQLPEPTTLSAAIVPVTALFLRRRRRIQRKITGRKNPGQP